MKFILLSFRVGERLLQDCFCIKKVCARNSALSPILTTLEMLFKLRSGLKKLKPKAHGVTSQYHSATLQASSQF